jgi:hypothetical protein
LIDPVLLSAHCASLVNVTAADDELRLILAVPLIACETEPSSSPPSAHAGTITSRGRNRVTALIMSGTICEL